MKFIIMFLLNASLFASEYEAGYDVYFQNGCSSCHGINAEGSGENPKLANKERRYIIKKIRSFQNGNANTQAGEVMFEFARRLSDEDLQNVSYFLSNHKKDATAKYEISDEHLGGLD